MTRLPLAPKCPDCGKMMRPFRIPVPVDLPQPIQASHDLIGALVDPRAFENACDTVMEWRGKWVKVP